MLKECILEPILMPLDWRKNVFSNIYGQKRWKCIFHFFYYSIGNTSCHTKVVYKKFPNSWNNTRASIVPYYPVQPIGKEAFKFYIS